MKKILVSVLVLLSMLMIFVGSVAAAPQMSVTFLDAFWTGAGVKFKFEVTENLGSGWITATISWNGGGANITCNQEGDIVTCNGPKTAADKNITITFMGVSYSTYVKSHSFCYGVFDWPTDGSNAWQNYSTHCQDKAAKYGDLIIWDNPAWGLSSYIFMPESPTPCIFDTEYGNNYYYPGCIY